MTKAIVVNRERCTGCRMCELVCSVKKEGASDPARARIRVMKREMEGFYLPTICRHCEDPPCEEACPVDAIYKDEETGRVVVDEDLCIGCGTCVSACPLGGIGFDEKVGRILKCDLCGGDPTCVKFCETKTIRFVEVDRDDLLKQKNEAERLYESFKGAAVR